MKFIISRVSGGDVSDLIPGIRLEDIRMVEHSQPDDVLRVWWEESSKQPWGLPIEEQMKNWHSYWESTGVNHRIEDGIPVKDMPSVSEWVVDLPSLDSFVALLDACGENDVIVSRYSPRVCTGAPHPDEGIVGKIRVYDDPIE